MASVIKTWFMMAFLMARPSDLPAGQGVLRLSLFAAIATYLLAGRLATESQWLIMPALFDLGLAAICYYTALNLWGKPERFNQAFSAYCGVTAILNLGSILMLPSASTEVSAAAPDTLQMTVYFVYLVWGITAFAHLLRFTFDLKIPASIALATGFLLINIFLLQTFFPA